MSESFKVQVNKVHEFDIDSNQLENLDVINLNHQKSHVISNNKSFKTEIISANYLQKNYSVKVNNNTYTVDIANELDQLIKQMGFEVGATKKVNEIKAPMPGLILNITVEVGQEVKEDDSLLILEAMKMENVLTSPRDGIIKSICVTKGDAVEKNQLLIAFE